MQLLSTHLSQLLENVKTIISNNNKQLPVICLEVPY